MSEGLAEVTACTKFENEENLPKPADLVAGEDGVAGGVSFDLGDSLKSLKVSPSVAFNSTILGSPIVDALARIGGGVVGGLSGRVVTKGVLALNTAVLAETVVPNSVVILGRIVVLGLPAISSSRFSRIECTVLSEAVVLASVFSGRVLTKGVLPLTTISSSWRSRFDCAVLTEVVVLASVVVVVTAVVVLAAIVELSVSRPLTTISSC